MLPSSVDPERMELVVAKIFFFFFLFLAGRSCRAPFHVHKAGDSFQRPQLYSCNNNEPTYFCYLLLLIAAFMTY